MYRAFSSRVLSLEDPAEESASSSVDPAPPTGKVWETQPVPKKSCAVLPTPSRGAGEPGLVVNTSCLSVWDEREVPLKGPHCQPQITGHNLVCQYAGSCCSSSRPVISALGSPAWAGAQGCFSRAANWPMGFKRPSTAWGRRVPFST